MKDQNKSDKYIIKSNMTYSQHPAINKIARVLAETILSDRLSEAHDKLQAQSVEDGTQEYKHYWQFRSSDIEYAAGQTYNEPLSDEEVIRRLEGTIKNVLVNKITVEELMDGYDEFDVIICEAIENN